VRSNLSTDCTTESDKLNISDYIPNYSNYLENVVDPCSLIPSEEEFNQYSKQFQNYYEISHEKVIFLFDIIIRSIQMLGQQS
jgi:hypothetical protein